MSDPQTPTDWQIEFQVPTRWRFIGETVDSVGADIRIYRWKDSELRVRRQVAGAGVTAADTCRLVLKQHADLHELQALYRQQVQEVNIAGRQGARVEGRLTVPGWSEHELTVLVAALAMETAAGQQEMYSVDIFTFGKRQGANDAVWRAVVDSMKVTGGGA